MTATFYRSDKAAAEVEALYRKVLDHWPGPKEERPWKRNSAP